MNKRVVRPLESYRRLKTLRSGFATALRRLRKVSAHVAAMLGDVGAEGKVLAIRRDG